jgi:hypothetical protein
MNTRMNILYCLLLTIILITGCKATPSKGAVDTTVVNVAKPAFDKRVSIVNLIATPERYNQKIIRVKGFLNLEFEGNAIYLHKEDCDLGIDKNGIWVDVTNGQIDSAHYHNCNKQYVILEGTFEMDNKGHDNGYGGSITKITRIDLLK